MAMRSKALGSAAVVAALVMAAGCSSGGGKHDNDAKGGSANGVITMTTGQTGVYTRNFNPFSPNAVQVTSGVIYEPLFYFNTVRSGDVKPWLGSSYSWSKDGRTLHVKLKHGVTWSDGKPFTSADVAYTFKLAMSDKTFNQFALPLAGVTTDGTYGVTITFTKPAFSQAYYALGRVMMLPKHVWQSIPTKQKTTMLNQHPVGTGAYTVSKVQGMNLTLTARSDYYVKGLPKVKQIRLRNFTSGTSSNAAVESGQLDWAGDFIPNIKKNYLAKNKAFKLVNIPLSTAFLVPNTVRGVTADPAVRRAISAGLDRKFISDTVYDGEAGPTNPMGLLLPNFSSALDPKLAHAKFSTGAAEVSKILTADGWAKGSDGIWAKGGKKLTISLEVIAGYTDYVSDVQIIQQQLKKVGIDIKIDSESSAQFTAHQSTGTFQMLISNYGYTPSPYSYYDTLLDSKIAPAIGKPDSIGNFGRYHNAKVDQALATIAATNDKQKQQAAFDTIEQTFVTDVPLIPLFNQQDEQEFNTSKITGFPTEQNPYASPAAFMQPDLGWVLPRVAAK